MGIRLKILAQVWAVGEKPAQVVETPSWTVESWTFVVKGRTNFIDGSIPNPRTGSSEAPAANSKM